MLFRPGMHNSNLTSGIFWNLRGSRAKTTLYPVQHISIKQTSKKVENSGIYRPYLKAFAGHIWPTGRML
jgi:hypothetical protein